MENETIKAARGNEGIKSPMDISPEEEIVYDQYEAILFIQNKFKNVVTDEPTPRQLKLTLDFEEDYMKSIGIIDSSDIDNDNGFIDP